MYRWRKGTNIATVRSQRKIITDSLILHVHNYITNFTLNISSNSVAQHFQRKDDQVFNLKYCPCAI